MPCDAHVDASSADLMASLGALARACSAPHGEHELSPARDARQAQTDAVDRYTFSAKAGGCYRVYAVGDADIQDIDVRVSSPAASAVAADDTHAGHAVVPSAGAFCVPSAGTCLVEVGVARGSGRYVLQVWER